MKIFEIQRDCTQLGIHARQITLGQEYAMVRQFIDYKEEIYADRNMKNIAVFIEPKIGGFYPDVVFTEFDPAAYENWTSSRNNLTISDLKILYLIYKGDGITSENIAKILSLKYKTILQSVENLMDVSLIERRSGCWRICRKEKFFGVQKIEAIEAKINDWQVVMQQAVLNRNFASESSVLLRRKKIPSPMMMEQAKRLGLGVYTYDDERFRKASSAKKLPFPVSYNSLLFNEYIGRILNQ